MNPAWPLNRCHAGQVSHILLLLVVGGHSARRHTSSRQAGRHGLHYRWAGRTNLFVLRWLQFHGHRTLGLQINIPGFSGSQLCFERGDRQTGIMAAAWGEFFKTLGTFVFINPCFPLPSFFFLLSHHGFICHLLRPSPKWVKKVEASSTVSCSELQHLESLLPLSRHSQGGTGGNTNEK